MSAWSWARMLLRGGGSGRGRTCERLHGHRTDVLYRSGASARLGVLSALSAAASRARHLLSCAVRRVMERHGCPESSGAGAILQGRGFESGSVQLCSLHGVPQEFCSPPPIQNHAV